MFAISATLFDTSKIIVLFEICLSFFNRFHYSPLFFLRWIPVVPQMGTWFLLMANFAFAHPYSSGFLFESKSSRLCAVETYSADV
jgi:hypothetical protein